MATTTTPATTPNAPPARDDGDDRTLIAHITQRVKRLDTRDTSGAVLEIASNGVNGTARLGYVEDEYVRSLHEYASAQQRWRRRQMAFTVLVFVGGAAGSIAGALGAGQLGWKTTAIIAGAVVAALTTINQALAPGAKANKFGTGYADLREEGWDYVNWLAAYKKLRPGAPTGGRGSANAKQASADELEKEDIKKDVEAYDQFAERVRSIVRRTRSGTQTEDIHSPRK